MMAGGCLWKCRWRALVSSNGPQLSPDPEKGLNSKTLVWSRRIKRVVEGAVRPTTQNLSDMCNGSEWGQGNSPNININIDNSRSRNRSIRTGDRPGLMAAGGMSNVQPQLSTASTSKSFQGNMCTLLSMGSLTSRFILMPIEAAIMLYIPLGSWDLVDPTCGDQRLTSQLLANVQTRYQQTRFP